IGFERDAGAAGIEVMLKQPRRIDKMRELSVCAGRTDAQSERKRFVRLARVFQKLIGRRLDVQIQQGSDSSIANDARFLRNTSGRHDAALKYGRNFSRKRSQRSAIETSGAAPQSAWIFPQFIRNEYVGELPLSTTGTPWKAAILSASWPMLILSEPVLRMGGRAASNSTSRRT